MVETAKWVRTTFLLDIVLNPQGLYHLFHTDVIDGLCQSTHTEPKTTRIKLQSFVGWGSGRVLNTNVHEAVADNQSTDRNSIVRSYSSARGVMSYAYVRAAWPLTTRQRVLSYADTQHTCIVFGGQPKDPVLLHITVMYRVDPLIPQFDELDSTDERGLLPPSV